MSTKVIKHGEKSFKATCPICGCEFEYTCEDIEMNYVNYTEVPQIKCPDCGQYIYHKLYTIIYPTYPYTEPVIPDTITHPHITWGTKNINNDIDWCENCPNRDGPKDGLGNPIAGDSPCQWCSHSPLKVTCTSSTTQTLEPKTSKKSKPNTTTSISPDFTKYFDTKGK